MCIFIQINMPFYTKESASDHFALDLVSNSISLFDADPDPIPIQLCPMARVLGQHSYPVPRQPPPPYRRNFPFPPKIPKKRGRMKHSTGIYNLQLQRGFLIGESFW